MAEEKFPRTIHIISGILFNFEQPDQDDIRIDDIAHALGNICRFGGHTKRFYSVAQHSVYASYLINDPSLRKAALLHDATEAYLVDLPRPIKVVLPHYKVIEDNLAGHIASSFGLPIGVFDHPTIKAVDNLLMAMEGMELCSNPELVIQWAGGRPDITLRDLDRFFEPWTPEEASSAFLDRFRMLIDEENETPNFI